MSKMGLRYRLYACERLARERMIGECIVGFASLNLSSGEKQTIWAKLMPRSNLGVSIGLRCGYKQKEIKRVAKDN